MDYALPANDATPDGWYMLLRSSGGNCHTDWQRLRYPAEQTAADMQAAGLKCGYTESICTGLWPSEDVLPTAERIQRGQPLQPAQIPF